MSKTRCLKKQIDHCVATIETQQHVIEKSKQQLTHAEEYKPLLLVACGASFLIGFLHVVSPRFRRVANHTAKLAFSLASKSGVLL